MRYSASEKLEIIRLVEESHLSVRLTLAKLGIPRTTFYRYLSHMLCMCCRPMAMIDICSAARPGCRINLPNQNMSGTHCPTGLCEA